MGRVKLDEVGKAVLFLHINDMLHGEPACLRSEIAIYGSAVIRSTRNVSENCKL